MLARVRLPSEQASADCLRGDGALRSECAGVAHALCVWIDFDFSLGASEGLEISTGPREALCSPTPWRQGVLLLPRPMVMALGQTATVSFEMRLRGARAGELRGTVTTGA